MSENSVQKEKPGVERGRADLLTIGLAVCLTQLLPMWKLLPAGEAFLVGWLVAFAIGYWLPPRPAESHARWMIERLTLITAFYLAFFKVPPMLKQSMSELFAYGIPLLVLFAVYALAVRWIRRSAVKGEPDNSLNPSAQ